MAKAAAKPVEKAAPKESGGKDTAIAGIAYLLVAFLGLLGLIIDAIIWWKVENKYAKFHAGQAALLSLVLTIIGVVLGTMTTGTAMIGAATLQALPAMGSLIVLAIYGVLSLLLCLVLAIMAFMGRDFVIPVIGEWLRKQ